MVLRSIKDGAYTLVEKLNKFFKKESRLDLKKLEEQLKEKMAISEGDWPALAFFNGKNSKKSIDDVESDDTESEGMSGEGDEEEFLFDYENVDIDDFKAGIEKSEKIEKKLTDEEAVREIEKIEKAKGFYKKDRRWLRQLLLVGLTIAVGLGGYLLKNSLKKPKLAQVTPIQTVTQTKPSEISEPEAALIKSISKRVWIDNGTERSDGNELELKVIDNKWDINGMQGVDFDVLYLLLTFDDGRKEVLKFVDGRAAGYVNNTIDERIRFAEVVQVSYKKDKPFLVVHATYKKQFKQSSESDLIEKVKQETKQNKINQDKINDKNQFSQRF